MGRRGRGSGARLIGAVRRDRAGLLLTTALTTAVLGVVALPAHAQLAPDTQPSGGVVVAGSARIGATSTTTTVTQGTARAAVNWQSFNVGSQATVNFVQPSASAVTLNRVLAPDPSVIAGHIHANGGIVITNRAGVVFAHGAEVNAASVLVSAADISNQNFMAGRMQFDIPAKPGARIVNEGHITVQAAGLAALVAPEVANSGVITANLGHVILAGGAAAETLDLYGDGLVSLDVTAEAHPVRLANGAKATALVTNSGTILARGGTVELTAKEADGLVQDLVDAGGTIAANSLGAHAGTIDISGIGGSIRIPGTLLAVGQAPGTTGGAIALDATGAVTLTDRARVNASGAAGGGTIAIGTTLARARGGPGTVSALTARSVSIAPRARIAADATFSGNGGGVSIQSLGTTAIAGSITARGGPQGGNGGSAEISGENLSLSGGVDASAPLGVTGSILLDPIDLTIVPSGASDKTDVTTTPLNGVAYGAGGANDTVSAGAIEGLTGNVTLQATSNLEIATNLSLGIGQALTLQAGNNLTIDPNATVTAGGNIDLEAASAAIPATLRNAAGTLVVQGTVTAGGDLSASAGTGGIIISTGGAIGGVTPGPGSISGGNVTLNATGPVNDALGSISAATLSGSSAGVGLIGNNSIGTLASFDSSAGGTFNLEDKAPLTITGKVAVPSGGFLAIEADALAISGGMLVAPGGTVQLAPYTATNAVALIGSGRVGAGTLAITKSDLGAVSANVLQIGTPGGGPIIIGNAGDTITIPNGLSLLLVSGSGVSEPGSLNVGDLAGLVGSATLDSTSNAVGTLGNFSDLSGGFALTETKNQALLVSGQVSVQNGQTIALTADGVAIGPSGSLNAPGGSVTLASAKPGLPLDFTTGLSAASLGTFSLGDTIANTAAINAATLAIGATGAGAMTVAGAIALPGIGLLDLMSGGALTETTAGSLGVGTLAANVQSANLTGSNAIGTLQAIAASGGFTLTDTENLTLANLIDATGAAVQLNDPGFAISEQGGSIEAGFFTGSGASATLTGANQIATLGAFPASIGGLSLTEAVGQALTVTGAVSVAAGKALALATDGIALGPTGALSATGGSVTLTSATPGLPLDVTTGLAAASLGTFSLGDATAHTAAITAATLAIGVAGAGGAGAVTVTGSIALPDIGLLHLLSNGAVSETNADSLSVGTLAADVASASLTGSNAIGTLGVITAAGGFTLTDTQNLTLAGLIDAGSGTVQLNDRGFAIVEQTTPPAGLITAGTLTGNAASATFANANEIGALGVITAAGGFTLTDAENLTLAGLIDAGSGSVQLNDPGFAITEQGGSIEAGFLNGSGASATLTDANHIDTLGSFSVSAGDFSLTEAPNQPLSVTGPVSALTTGETIALTADTLAIGAGALAAPGGTVQLAPSTATNAVALVGSGSSGAGTLAITDADLGGINASVLQVGTLGGGPIIVGNVGDLISVPNSVTSLVLESGGAISENGRLSAPAATLSGFAGDRTLAGASGVASFGNSNTLASLGSFTALGGFTFANSGNVILTGFIDAGSATANLTSISGNIQEEAGPPPGTITAGTLSASAGGSIDLGEANDIGTLANVSAPGGFAFNDPGGFSITGSVSADVLSGTVALSSNGAVVENGGSISAFLLTGTLGSATLGGNNFVSEIGSFTAHSGLSLTDERVLGLFLPFLGTLAITGTVDIGSNQANFTVINGDLAESSSAVLTAGTLSGSAFNVSLPSGSNAIGTLGAFAAPGGFTLETAGGLKIAGVVNTGGAVTDLFAGADITEVAGGTLVGGELTGSAGGSAGNAAFVNANTLASLGSFTALGGFTLADAGSLALEGPLDAGSATVVLTGGAAVTEPSGSITASTLAGALASAALGGANRIDNLANFSAAGGFSLNDLGALTLSGPVSAGSAGAAFTLGGSLVQTTAGILTAGAFAGNATLIDLTDSTNAITSLGAITAPGGLSLATATGLSIAGTVATGAAPISLRAGAAITEVAGGTLIAGALTGSASAASFANTNSIAELGSFTAPGGFTLDNGGDLPIAGPLDAGASTALLVAGGSLYETTATTFGGTTVGSITAGTLTGRAGQVALVSAQQNLIANLGSFTTGAFNLNDGEDLAVIGTVTGNPIGINVNGNLALGSGAGSGLLSSTGAVFLNASGAITEPAGTIDAAILTGTAASASLPGANLVPLLGAFSTTGPFLLNAAEPALAVNGPLSAGSANLAAAGSLILAGVVSAGAATLSAGGPITEAGGVISAGTLAGSAASATLTASNTIATLGAFTTPGSLLLTDATPLAVAGPVTASFLGLTDLSDVSFTGATDVGTLSIMAGGSITEPSGTVTAGLIEGSANGLAQFGPDAPAGSASVGTFGPFSVSTGTFTLTDSVPLTIIGPLSASDFAISAPGSIVVTNATITTVGLPAAQQSGLLSARPGSYFDVSTAAGQFLELGRTTINPLGGPATVRIDLNLGGGLISFADLVAPTTTLILNTGLGSAIGTIDIGALIVIGNLGSAMLSGMVANLSGVVASSKATISPFQSARYRLNSCPLMSINCIFIAPEQVPQGNPLSGLAIISAPPNQQDIDLLLPNVAAQDY